MLWSAVFLLLVQTLWSSADEFRVVKTTQGPVKGYKDPDGGLYVFYSIPYAAAPTGPYKFKAPLPAPIWFDTFEAIDKGIVCPQADFALRMGGPIQKFTKEDCLIANIFVPDTEETNLPVVVYVHGGGFFIGSGNLMTPKNFVKTKNTIVVTFNYRLGAHGFLCLGTEDAPGNAGMKDQVALLRWVKKNIANFGGNPDDVTISGYSAGSVSVDLLSLSKSTKGLFKHISLESGVSSASIAVQIDPVKNAQTFAKHNNLTDVDDIYKLEEYYKNAPLQDLIITNALGAKDSSILFSPCVEQKTSEEIFLHDAPVNIIKRGDYERYPTLIGFADKEGLLRLPEYATFMPEMNSNFEDFLPVDLQFETEEEKKEVANSVKEYYFGDKYINQSAILSFIDYFSDIMFVYPSLRGIGLHLKNGHNSIYLYEYSYVDKEMPPIPFTEVRGATHCAQSMAILDGISLTVKDEENISEETKKHKRDMRDIWYNFAKTGIPKSDNSELPDWQQVKSDNSPYMSLGDVFEMKTNLIQERKEFWDEIYSKYYRTPSPPPKPPQVHSEL